MSRARGRVYRCRVCGAEVAVIGPRMGDFRPRCCNQDMAALARGLVFYMCPICRAEIAVVRRSAGDFMPRCCNREMVRHAA